MRYRVLKSLKYILKYNFNLKTTFYNRIVLRNDTLLLNLYEYSKLKNSINNTSITKIRNRCIINGKSRSVYKKYRLSRHSFKFYASNGLINGVRKK
jgi:ribosomal protein S14